MITDVFLNAIMLNDPETAAAIGVLSFCVLLMIWISEGRP